jgi:hypothetical protein
VAPVAAVAVQHRWAPRGLPYRCRTRRQWPRRPRRRQWVPKRLPMSHRTRRRWVRESRQGGVAPVLLISNSAPPGPVRALGMLCILKVFLFFSFGFVDSCLCSPGHRTRASRLFPRGLEPRTTQKMVAVIPIFYAKTRYSSYA